MLEKASLEPYEASESLPGNEKKFLLFCRKNEQDPRAPSQACAFPFWLLTCRIKDSALDFPEYQRADSNITNQGSKESKSGFFAQVKEMN